MNFAIAAEKSAIALESIAKSLEKISNPPVLVDFERNAQAMRDKIDRQRDTIGSLLQKVSDLEDEIEALRPATSAERFVDGINKKAEEYNIAITEEELLAEVQRIREEQTDGT